MDTPRRDAPPVVAVMVVHEPDTWFDETLAALASQDYPDLRLLFLVTGDADDAGTQAAVDRIRGVAPSAFVRAIGGNPGYGPAVDEVLRLVEGDNGFFLLCHDDIAPAPDVVSVLVTELYRSNAGMVGPKLVEWDEPRRLQHVGLGVDRFGEVDPIVEPGEVDQEQHDAVRDVFVLPSACILVRADLFRRLGGFDPAVDYHGDDVDLCWRAHLLGARVVVAPDARVRHREQLQLRRPDLNHRQLAARHRMRSVATLTGGSRLLGRSVQMVLLTLVELVVGLFTGRFGEALASLRALVGLVPRTPALVARRRAVAPQRVVPEREVLGLQLRGSARLSSYLRGRETTTYVGLDSAVRRWRETSFGPLLAWFLVLLAIVIGSRTIIDRGVPQVGEFLPFPDSPRRLVDAYLSAWDPRSLGATSAVPTGLLTIAGLSVFALFRMDLLMTLLVLAMIVVGASGAWRLATVFPTNRARIAGMVVYVGTPLVPGLMATGDWSALVWYAALPWLVHLLRRSVGIATAEPSLDSVDLVDGIMPIDLRQRIRFVAAMSLVLGLAAAFAPETVVLWLLAGVVIAVASLLAGVSLATVGWLAAGTVVSSAVAVVLNLPWATTWSWSDLNGPALEGGAGDGFVRAASLSVDGRDFVVLALALYLPLLAALAITRAWRLTWAVRGAGLVVVFLGLAILEDTDRLPFEVPARSMLSVPIALGLALGAAAIAGGFGADVRGRGFGWRQPAALLANVAVVVALVPAVVSIGDGSWDAPRTPLSRLVAAQLPEDPARGDYRVLFVGDPRILPVPGVEYRPGIAYAVVDDGALDFTDRWEVPETAADPAVERAIDRIADGSTLRVGRLLAPLGIRYVVVPLVDGAASTVSDPLPVPGGLISAIGEQLDIGETYGPPSLEIFENLAWIPARAELTGATAQASLESGDEALVRADTSQASPRFTGGGHLEPTVDEVAPGVVHHAVPFDDRWTLTVGDQDVPARASFGVATAYDVGGDGVAELTYGEPGSRRLLVVLQVVLWVLVLVAASRARSPFGRSGVAPIGDETLIDLDVDDETLLGDDHLPDRGDDELGDQHAATAGSVLDPLMPRSGRDHPGDEP